MHLFLSQLLNGIGNGVVYASVALALVLIYRTTGLLNFAQGEMALFSTYITWKLTEPLDCPSAVAIALSMVIAFVGRGGHRAGADPAGRAGTQSRSTW